MLAISSIPIFSDSCIYDCYQETQGPTMLWLKCLEEEGDVVDAQTNYSHGNAGPRQQV